MSQYSKTLGVHAYDWTKHNVVTPTLRMVPVPIRDSKVLEHKFSARENTVSSWRCACGSEIFRVYAHHHSTIAKCTECENEHEIHEG
jgi:hypothetical protein